MAAVVLALASCNRSKSGGGDSSSGESAGSSLALLKGFEGEIGIAVKQAKPTKPGGEVPPLSLEIKGNKVRVDIPPALQASQPNLKGYGVLDTPEKKLFFVMDEQKQVIVFDLNQAGEQLKSMKSRPGMPRGAAPEAPNRPPPKVTKTGVTDKVAGYACENWDVSDEARKVATVCVGNEGASWFHLPITGIPTEYAWALELLDGKHFPLRAIGYGQDGAEEGRVEVTKIEKKPLAASLFEIPAGYRVMDLMTMMQTGFGMLPGGGMPGATHAGGLPAMHPPPPRAH